MNKTMEKVCKTKLKELLSKCKKEQIDQFNRIYGSVDNAKAEDINHAFGIIERTIKNNNG